MARPKDPDSAISELEALRFDNDKPRWVQHIAGAGADRLRDVQRALAEGDLVRAESLVKGIDQILPIGLRGTDLLDELAGIVEVDDAEASVTVTVHWERVPRDKRKAAASLASFIVDFYYGRPEGGRPRTKRRRRSSDAATFDSSGD